MITKEDLELFEKHKHLYEMLVKHSYIRNYTKETYIELISLYTKYVSDKHNFSHWCSSCRSELVNYLYQWYVNNTTEPIIIEDLIVQQEIKVYPKKRKK